MPDGNVTTSGIVLPMGGSSEGGAKGLAAAAIGGSCPKSELTSLDDQTYVYSIDMATKLGIQFAGSVDIDAHTTRIIIFKNYILYKPVQNATSGGVDWLGAGIRFTVNAKLAKGSASLSFPGIAAQATLNGWQQCTHYEVVGLASAAPDLLTVSIPPQLDVETYAKTFDAFGAATKAVAAIAPDVLVATERVGGIVPGTFGDYVTILAQAWGIARAADGQDLAHAQASFPLRLDTNQAALAHGAIEETYRMARPFGWDALVRGLRITGR